jgi:hypothetical protein
MHQATKFDLSNFDPRKTPDTAGPDTAGPETADPGTAGSWAKAEVRAGQSGEATWFIDPLPYKFDRLKAQAWPLMDAYNQAAAKYNEAVSQFPASVLAKQVKFVPAQTLDIADLLA